MMKYNVDPSMTSISDLDFQTSLQLTVSWDVTDNESGITDCEWAVGEYKTMALIQDIVLST